MGCGRSMQAENGRMEGHVREGLFVHLFRHHPTCIPERALATARICSALDKSSCKRAAASCLSRSGSIKRAGMRAGGRRELACELSGLRESRVSCVCV
jgi:hypothetical protein